MNDELAILTGLDPISSHSTYQKKIICYLPPHTHIDSNDYAALKISNVTIEKAKWVKFLGVYILMRI